MEVIVGLLYLIAAALQFKDCLTMELEYAKVVKQTFGVPGTPGNPMVGVGSPTLGNNLQKDAKMAEEDEMSSTANVLTTMVLSTIGILLALIFFYFCCSCVASCIGCMRRIREKQHRSRQMIKEDSLTSSSSLESV